ncbi:MAG: hypothetical protein IJ300_11360, partial [Clostridia bacterium]|nr:hypothetical protein [Clostridia bacterium]
MYVVFFFCVSPYGNINNNNYNNNNNGVRPYWWIVRQSRRIVRNQNTHIKRTYNLSAVMLQINKEELCCM